MIASAPQAPEWINCGATITGGLDLLGLRLPVQTIGGTLLDDVTTVTPSVRYLAFRAWLIYRYGQSGRADSWQTFTEFASRVESALVLGNLIKDPSIGGLIGSEQALERIAQGETHVQISSLVKSPASTIYTGPSDRLGISKSRDNAVPALVMERGLPLAKAVDQKLMNDPLIKRLIRDDDLITASIDDLVELGRKVRIAQIPEDERGLLLSAIMPPAPRPTELNRIRTYSALLTMASQQKSAPSEAKFFDVACSLGRFGEPLVDQVADGWVTYCVRDAIAVTQEGVLAAVMGEILGQPDGGLSGVDRNVVIESLIERIEEHDSALRDLNLLSSGESVADLTFRALEDRIRSRLLIAGAASGVVRWSDRLVEPLLYRRALKSGAGALTLAVVAWVMAAVRVGDAVREDKLDYRSLSHQGRRRQGMREIVLPELERFRREDRRLCEVAAEMALRTVQQHLQITWSRLQVDLTRDVGLLTAEGNKWFARGKGFVAGRTASRIQQAVGWLHQLKLIDASGITADGAVILQRALATLAKWETT
ncbi:hypothetical protein [Aeromonas media]|uniref:hypothetical protein n=1 Tax=Aeromonas media TaxID=651 RepID=UPI0038D109C9